MPKRTRSHELEEESRRNFRSLLPARWVCRDIHPDYGIDCHVELFDESGLATGVMYFVQLKASEKSELAEALAIRLKTETYWYCRRLDLPVMLACWHGPSGQLFWKWFHEFKERPAEHAKSISLTLSASAAWNEGTPAKVEADLQSFRQLQASSLPHPIPFSLVFDGAKLYGISAPLIESALLKTAASDSAVLHLSNEVPVGAHPGIAFFSEKIVVSWGGLCSLTLKSPEQYQGDAEKLAADLLTAVAFVLSKSGHPNEGATIALNHLTSGMIQRDADIFFELLGSVVKARRFSDALSMARQILNELKQPELVRWLLLPALASQSSFRPSELELLREVMQLLIVRTAELGDDRMTAAAHYNLGNHLRGQGPVFRKAAFREYRIAAKLDPGYRERAYFWQEVSLLPSSPPLVTNL